MVSVSEVEIYGRFSWRLQRESLGFTFFWSWGPPKQTWVASVITRPQRDWGGLGDPIAPVKINRGREILRLLLNSYRTSQFGFEENRSSVIEGAQSSATELGLYV